MTKVVSSDAACHGIITAAFGRHYEVSLASGRVVCGIPRGKKSPYACGDRVRLGPLHDNNATILSHAARTSLLYRRDAWKEKIIAANVTQIVMVVAAEPAFSAELLSRTLVAAQQQNLRYLIVLNKCDLQDKLTNAHAQLEPFTKLAIPIIELAARFDATPLLPLLAGQLSVLVGQSGMGKSTLINAVVPTAQAATREISSALDSGKHTTTHARYYKLDDSGAIIDSPGLQAFGLAQLTRGQIEMGFSEFAPYLEQCRFRDCRHEDEPDCAIKAAVAAKQIDARRLAHFISITRELER